MRRDVAGGGRLPATLSVASTVFCNYAVITLLKTVSKVAQVPLFAPVTFARNSPSMQTKTGKKPREDEGAGLPLSVKIGRR